MRDVDDGTGCGVLPTILANASAMGNPLVTARERVAEAVAATARPELR